MKRLEHVCDRRLHLLVGIRDPLALIVVEVADRQREPQLAALGGVAFCALQPDGHHV